MKISYAHLVRVAYGFQRAKMIKTYPIDRVVIRECRNPSLTSKLCSVFKYFSSKKGRDLKAPVSDTAEGTIIAEGYDSQS